MQSHLKNYPVLTLGLKSLKFLIMGHIYTMQICRSTYIYIFLDATHGGHIKYSFRHLNEYVFLLYSCIP